MIVDATWDRFPTAARILEIANELAFFAVDADDRQMTALEAVAQLGEIFNGRFRLGLELVEICV